jgi:DMSO/TMAO reductase YedYZ molybdopterin-dependent catalytic subunit
MRKTQNILNASLAGAVAVLIVEAILLPFWLLAQDTAFFAPKLVSDFIIEHTPPDNAISLQNALGAFAMPSALMGGVMFVAIIGLLTGLAYTLIRARSRPLAIIIASLMQPLVVLFCFPNTGDHPVALLPLLLTGPILDRLTRRDSQHTELQSAGITRRRFLSRLVIFSLGGTAVSIVGGIPVYLSELASRRPGRRLFDFAPPQARQAGFAIAELAPEITPVENFYQMRKFATPVPSVPPGWKLTIGGLVERPVALSLDDLMQMQRKDVYLTRQCISNPVGGSLISTAMMSGVMLSDVIRQAGVKPGAVDLVFYGRDGYSESVPVAYALEHGLLAYAMNGVYLPEIHGAPVRLEVPGLYGFKNMKWLDRIEVVDKHYVAIWEEQGWAGQPIVKTMSRIDVIKTTARGVLVAGIAYAGLRSISAVEVKLGDGDWQSAMLHVPPLANRTWVQWRAEIENGEILKDRKLSVSVRAVDGLGAPQIEVPQKQFPNGASGLHTATITLAG